MEVRQLRYFLAVAEQLNYRKAAEQLYVTQPLLSKQIADLEHEIGTPLLMRNTRQVWLTPAGERLKAEAEQIIRQVSTVTKSVQRAAMGTPTTGTLKICYEEAFDRLALVGAVYSFRQLHPEVEVTLHSGSFAQCVAMLNSNQADCAFIVLPDKKLSPNIACQVLHSDRLCFVANKDLLGELSLEAFLQLAQQKGLYLLEKSPKGFNLMGTLLSSLSAEPDIVFVNDLTSMLLYAEIGAGVTIVPRTVFDAYQSACLVSHNLPGHAQLCMACAWNEQNANPLREFLLDEFPLQEKHCNQCESQWCRFYPRQGLSYTENQT